MNDEKQKWPHAEAMAVAEMLVAALRPSCARIEIAGSLRRRKPLVGDVEIVYVPRFDTAMLPGEMFPKGEQNLADLTINTLLLSGVLEKRRNAKGAEMFGEKNKLVRHCRSGIPVDLFATTEDCWFNYLVCRTGGSESNVAICNAAIARGWKWTPYGPGFEKGPDPDQREGDKRRHIVGSEREVFEFVGLPYKNPEER